MVVETTIVLGFAANLGYFHQNVCVPVQPHLFIL
jgi:hypothetical protein